MLRWKRFQAIAQELESSGKHCMKDKTIFEDRSSGLERKRRRVKRTFVT